MSPDNDAKAERLTDVLIAADQAIADGTPPDALDADVRGAAECIRLLREALAPKSAGADLPAQVGRFEVRGELGRGSFGVVFLAYDPQLRREVALKVPRVGSLLAGDLRDRFLREARAAAALEHPNIVPVHEAGEAESLCYIASAYCPGSTLGHWLKTPTGQTPPRTAAALVAALADAVQHAHERGVIHRDLKPSNIILQPAPIAPDRSDGLDFIPRVTDFGLARLTEEDTLSTALTRSGAIVGTPEYMAPEQAAGRNRDVGPAADVYSLGVILYELLAGRPPFQGETVLETLDRVRFAAPEPPSRLASDVPAELDAICLKCLEKEPTDRYISAGDLADDLGRFFRGEPIRSSNPSPWGRFWRWCRRPQRVRDAGICMLVVTGFYLIYWLAASVVFLSGLVQLERPAAGFRYALAYLALVDLPMLWIGYRTLRGSLRALWAGFGYALLLLLTFTYSLVVPMFDIGGLETMPLAVLFQSMFVVWNVFLLASQVIGLIGYHANRRRGRACALHDPSGPSGVPSA